MAEGYRNSDLLYLLAMSHKWLGKEEPTDEEMAKAHFLEEHYWRRMEAHVAIGIDKAFGHGN